MSPIRLNFVSCKSNAAYLNRFNKSIFQIQDFMNSASILMKVVSQKRIKVCRGTKGSGYIPLVQAVP